MVYLRRRLIQFLADRYQQRLIDRCVKLPSAQGALPRHRTVLSLGARNTTTLQKPNLLFTVRNGLPT